MVILRVLCIQTFHSNNLFLGKITPFVYDDISLISKFVSILTFDGLSENNFLQITLQCLKTLIEYDKKENGDILKYY